MARFAWFFAALLWLLPVAQAGTADDANAVLDGWSAAFTSNDPEAVADKYWPEAILLGTVSPVISQGREAIVKYFTPIKGTGSKRSVKSACREA